MSGAVARASRAGGLDALVLENTALRVTVLPEVGGHVAELVDVAAGRDVLWHNQRTSPRPAPYGAYFDDWWSGGWDEIFPSGDRGSLHGEPLPYMGELWCVPWTAESASGGGEASITTTAFATVAPARFERQLSLRNDEPVLHAHYRIENLDVRPLPFTWGIHPAFAVGPAHRIDHPGETMLVGVSSDQSMGVAGSRYSWPGLPDAAAGGGVRDMSRVRARSDAVFGGHWALGLPEGWLALTDTSDGRGVGLAFDPSLFRHAWLWQVYGGWRGHHHVALEPWTSSPMQLDEALVAGQALVLEAGGFIETDVEIVIFGDGPIAGTRGGAFEGLRRRAEAMASR